MRRTHAGSWLAVGLACCLGMVLTAAQVPLAEFEQILRSVPISQMEPALSALARGMTHEDFPSQPLMLLFTGLLARPVPSEEKDALIQVLLQTLSDDLPIKGLVSKGLEGLARGIPLTVITLELHGRRILLSETRRILASKGIVAQRDADGTSSQNAIPSARLRQLSMDISEAIADFLAAGHGPVEDPQALYLEVASRLTYLRGVTLWAEDVALVLERLTSQDFEEIAQSIARR